MENIIDCYLLWVDYSGMGLRYSKGELMCCYYCPCTPGIMHLFVAMMPLRIWFSISYHYIHYMYHYIWSISMWSFVCNTALYAAHHRNWLWLKCNTLFEKIGSLWWYWVSSHCQCFSITKQSFHILILMACMLRCSILSCCILIAAIVQAGTCCGMVMYSLVCSTHSSVSVHNGTGTIQNWGMF